MKALICSHFGLPETLEVGELCDPLPGPDQILIEVEACGVNFPDVLLIQNKYQFKPELPFSPGGEVSGKILEIGENVENFKIGDPVLALCGWGGFAERVVVADDRFFAMPPGL